VDDRLVVLRRDLHCGVLLGRRGAADEERLLHAAALHLGGDVDHLVERGRDEAGQADDVHLVLLRCIEDLIAGHHDAEVDDLVVVAAEHHPDDVLADVVDVALDRRHEHLALRLSHDATALLLLPRCRAVR
jgi:hypothetical protein